MITPGPNTVRKRDRPRSPRYLSEAQIVRETSPKGDGCCRARAGRFDTLASSRVAATATLTNHRAQGWTADESKFMAGLPGALPPMGNFDPAGFTEGKSVAELKMLREAEVTHGRVSMLASLGFLVQENFHPLFNGLGGPAIEQIPQLPAWLWFVGTLGVGICEANRIQIGWANPYENPANVQALKPGYTPGDLNFDPLGLKPTDPAELREMQAKELSHGRLGMLAAAGFMAQEMRSPGSAWLELKSAGFTA